MTVVWDEIFRFNTIYFPGWRAKDEIFYSNALAGEVGEICNMTKHRAGGGTNKSNPSASELMDEISDTFIYLAILVEIMGRDVTSLAAAIHSKLEINTKRMKELDQKNKL
jgi:NTP pyrophosphatase (non-canonical NTP hydrolase)